MPVVNPGIRRLLASAIQRLFNGASFSAPLTHSLVPERGTGSPTFTRATTATVRDNEGVLRTAIAGEARFEGARRVYNKIPTTSENFDNAAWTKSAAGGGSAPVVTADQDVNPVSGVAFADKIVFSAPVSGDISFLTSGAVGVASGNKGLASFYIKAFAAGDVGKTILIRHVGAAAYSTYTLTASYVRVSSVETSSGTSATFGIGLRPSEGGSAGTVSVYLAAAMLEDITGRTDQTTPSEYVSVGVASSPYYHGSMVDGVKCFATDINGAAIPSTTLLGYLAEGARTNLCRYSQSIAAGFTFSGTCTGTDNVGTYAGVPFTRINAATGGVSYIACSYTGDGTKAFSCLLKKDGAVTGTYSVGFYDNSASVVRGYVTATIAADGGMTFAANGGCTVTGSRELADGVWELQGTVAGIVASNANIYYANFAVGTATSCLVSAMQTENASFPSTYIATTTVAVTRDADILTYSGGDIPNLKTLMAGFRREVGVSNSGYIAALTNGTLNELAASYMNTATQHRFNGIDGGVGQWDTISSNAYTPGTQSKMAQSFATNDVKMAKDGVAQTPDTVATMPTVTQLEIGCVTGAFQLNGNVGGIYGWTRNLSQSEVNAVTV